MDKMEWQNRYAHLLAPGEYLLWADKPTKGHIFQAADVFLIPFSLFWTGFALFWEYMAYQNGIWFFMLFGIPFVLIGLYLLVGRFFHRAIKRGRTSYAVTDKRLLEVCGNRVKSVERSVIEHMDMDMNADGSGSIMINQRTEYRYSGRRGRTSTLVNDFCFDNVPDINTVYQLLSTDVPA